MQFSVQQRVFIVRCFVRHGSWRRVIGEFRTQFPNTPVVPSKVCIYKLTKKFETTGSILNKKRVPVNRVLTEAKLDDIGHCLERSPKKSISKLAAQCDISKSSAYKATKLLKLKPYKTTSVQFLSVPDYAARLNYCRWFQTSVHDGLVDPSLVFYSDEAWFTLHGSVNTQNSRYWATENPHIYHEQPLHDTKVGVWCALNSHRIIDPIFFDNTVNSERYVFDILTAFFEELSEEEKTYAYFMQDNAPPHTSNLAMEALVSVFGDRLISRGLWPARSPDLNPCDFYLWGTLKEKVYMNNPHTLEELELNIEREIRAISREQLQRVSANKLNRTTACIEAEGHHFQHLL